jgi:thioredoxin 1
VHLGRGSASAQKANLALMALPKQMISPKTGPQTRMIASMLGIGRTRGIGGAGLPTVIDFYAAWCQPCKQVDSALTKAKATYAEKVSFMRVDVDDPNSQPIMDQYDVSPIPTMVFLNSEGEVVSYSIGFAGDNSIASSIKKLLPPATAEAKPAPAAASSSSSSSTFSSSSISTATTTSEKQAK